MRKKSSGCYAINAVKRYVSRGNMKALYYSLVHSYLSYGILVWVSAFQYRFNKLDCMRKKCIRNISKVPYNEHTLQLLKNLKILKFNDIYLLETFKLMYSYNQCILPETLLITNANIHSYYMKHRHEPDATHSNSSEMSRSFIHQGPKFWLDLPVRIRDCSTKKCFNRNIKKHIISNY